MRSIRELQLAGLSDEQREELLASDQELLELLARDDAETDGVQELIENRLILAAVEKGWVKSEKVILGARIHTLVTRHSPKLTKQQRRERRAKMRGMHYHVQKYLIKRKTYELGIAKMKALFADIGEPGYDNPQFAERSGPRRKQRRVRSKLQPIRNQPQRVRTDRLAA